MRFFREHQVLFTLLIGCYTLSMIKSLENHSLEKLENKLSNSLFRHKRFAHFKPVLPTTTDKCIIACGSCGAYKRGVLNKIL